ncbi:MAG: sulfite exporter TauE/SafE family protein [Verrucomicrobiae bacterium]|nr:sulfite exporter TauE/SafE family protein [Verrucomicrobiae bacterium]
MSPLTIGLLGLVVCITHGLEAITGFGCTVLALPFVVALIGVQRGVILLAVLAWLLAGYIAIRHRSQINLREFLIIVALAGIGLPFGIYAFAELPVGALKKALGVFIVVAACASLFRMWKGVREGSSRLPIYHPLLVLGGAVHGAFASGGPLVVLYAAQKLRDKGQFRATLCLLWVTLNSILMVTYWRRGMLAGETVGMVGCMLPFLVLGVVVGERVHGHVNEGLFKRVVFSVLLCVGVIMVLMG